MPRTFSSRSAAKRLMTRRPLAVEHLEGRDVPATYTWVPTGPGAFAWNDAANWTGGPAGTFPNASGDVAVLTGALTGNQLVNLNQDITVGELDLGSTGVSGYTIAANGAAGRLTFSDGDGTANLTVTGTGGGDAVLAPITLSTNTTLDNTGAAPLLLGSTIAGGGVGLTTSGPVAAFDQFRVLSTVTLLGTGTITAPAVTYATSFYDGGLYAFDADTGATLATLVAPNAGAASLLLPAGLTVGPDGNLYVSGQSVAAGTNSITRYNLATFAAEPFITPAQLNAASAANLGDTEFNPAGLQFGPDGNLYVSQNGGFGGPNPDAVVRFNVASGGGLSYAGTFTTVATGLNLPNGLTFGTAAGDTTTLYVGTTAGVVRVAAATGAAPTTTVLVPAGSGGLEYASALAFGPDGDLFVADLGAFTNAGKVLRFNPDGSSPTTFVAAGTGAAPGDLFGQFPSDLYFDPQGRLLVVNLGPNGPTTGSNDYTGGIYRYTAAGAFDTALVTAAQFPDTQDTPTVGDDEATGVIPSQARRVAPITVQAPRVGPGSVGGPGILTVPNFDFAGGAFGVDVAGTTAGSGYDQLVSTGSVNLTFTQLFVTAPAAVPAGSVLTIVSAAAVTGTFDGLADGATVTAGGQSFTIDYTPTSVTLTRTADTPPAITSPTTVSLSTSQPSTYVVTATGSPAPTFAVTGGSLPAGLTLNPTTGAVTGTPTTAGTTTATITATNPFGTDAETVTFTVTAAVAPAITSANGAQFVAGTGGTFTVTATGTPTPTLAETAVLPAGVTFDPATGVLTVAPSAAAGSTVLTFTATNGVGSPASQNFALTIGTAPAITSPTATSFATGIANSFTVVFTGTPQPTISQTGTLPTGVTFNTSTGVLSGTPAAGTAGTYPITFSSSNLFGTTTQSFVLTVQASAAPAITSPTAAGFVVGQTNTFTVTTTGSPTPTLSVTGTLPAGVTFDPATGVLSGTPAAAAGTYPLTFTATNGNGTTAQNFTLTIGTPPVFTSANAVSFATGSSGAFTVTATGTPTPTLSFTGALPDGVTFDPATGQLAVAAGIAEGTYPIGFRADNGVDITFQNFTLTIQPSAAPAITSPAAALFGVGQPGSFTVTTAGTPTPTLTFAGTLPAGVTFNTSTGVLSGTPAAGTAGTYPLTLTATNGNGGPATQTFTLTVQAGATGTPPVFTSPDFALFSPGQVFSFTVTATGTPTPTFSVVGLPAGVTFDPATGVLSGSVSAVGIYPLTFTATNGVSTTSQSFRLGIMQGDPPPPPTTPDLPTRLSVSGPTNGGGLLFDPTAAGRYSDAQTAVLNPFLANGALVRTAVGDVDGDGTPDTIYVTGPGVPVRFAVVSGTDNRTILVQPTAPYGDEPFTGGGFVSTGDIDGDGRAEIVITPDQGGGPRVTIYGLPAAGGAAVVKANFFGIDDPTFRGGARSAVGDVNGDGTPDLAVAAGFLGGPRVSLLNGATLFGTPMQLVNDFFAFPGSDAVNLRNGAYVAAGDLDGDGFADLIFGGGPGGGPRVFALSGRAISGGSLDTAYANPVANFFVAGDTSSRSGVRVAAVDADGDGRADIVTGSGSGLPGGVRGYLGKNVTSPDEPTTFQDLTVFDGDALADGVYVG